MLFHPAQAALWPQHWRAANASLLYDWTKTTPIGGDDATAVLRALIAMPEARVRALQAGVADAARRTFYRGALGPAEQPDAVDTLVGTLLSLRAGGGAANRR